MIGAPFEGQEVPKQSRQGEQQTRRSEDRSLTKDTFRDFALGALGGAGFSVVGTALSGKDNTEAAADPVQEDADATFENTPEQPRLEAPGLQGLPEPDQVFYGDRAICRILGLLKVLMASCSPPQSQQWVNPENRTDAPVDLIGGEGMERNRAAHRRVCRSVYTKARPSPMTPPAWANVWMAILSA